ncbi:MAG TPA: lipopolysaccharide biosynthesis protein [Solirubrobacteraceae bacterium]|nr:lipopolysaccharide biosynthesis protein [Solirubrobacteraceae bacterium]
MSDYLRRLVRSLAAYQVADVVSKFMAVLLLPVYTRYIGPSGYSTVEVLANSVIFVSILARFGIIEAFLRFHFSDEDTARRDALARRAMAFLLATTTAVAVVLAAFAGPLSHVVLRHRDAGTFLVAVLGLWAFTNLELAYGLLRVDERVRAYAAASLCNVGLTIAASVVLVVALHQGPRGLLLGNYGASTVVLAALWWTMRDRLRPRRGAVAERLGVLLRFGLPTVPAEASVYALSLIDRYWLLYSRGRADVGLYSIAIKLAGTVAFIVRAFQYAWPPLAYSVRDDREAARVYSLVTTYYVFVSGWVVAALALLGRWILRLLAAPSFYGAHTALTWVSLGWACYGLWVVLLVIAGRAKVTTRNFPASLAGLAANLVLLALLIGPLGITGAGLALCGAYVVMLAVMHLLTRSAFAVAFEWARLARVAVVFGGLAAAGELLLPTHGVLGLLTRLALVALLPAALALTGFFHAEELRFARAALARARARGARGEAGA